MSSVVMLACRDLHKGSKRFTSSPINIKSTSAYDDDDDDGDVKKGLVVWETNMQAIDTAACPTQEDTYLEGKSHANLSKVAVITTESSVQTG